MTYQELYEMVPSDTLQRDLDYMIRTGECPSGYSNQELDLIMDYIMEGEEK